MISVPASQDGSRRSQIKIYKPKIVAATMKEEVERLPATLLQTSNISKDLQAWDQARASFGPCPYAGPRPKISMFIVVFNTLHLTPFFRK